MNEGFWAIVKFWWREHFANTVEAVFLGRIYHWAHYGIEEGDPCRRNGCEGVIRIAYRHDGGCSCFQVAPCSYCTTSYLYCPVCGWEGRP